MDRDGQTIINVVLEFLVKSWKSGALHYSFAACTIMLRHFDVSRKRRKRGKEDFGARKQLRIINILLKRQDIQMVITVCDFELTL